MTKFDPDEPFSPIIHPLTAKAANILRRMQVVTPRELSHYTYEEFAEVRNCGTKTMTDLTAILNMSGLHWKVTACQFCGQEGFDTELSKRRHQLTEHIDKIRIK